MRGVALIACMIGFASAMSCERALAEEKLSLKVGMELSYPPFEMTDPQGKPAGVSVVPSSGTADEAVGATPARRRGEGAEAYAVHCWAPNSSFTDPSCNCLGEGAHPKLGYRRTIRIIAGSWYGPPGLHPLLILRLAR